MIRVEGGPSYEDTTPRKALAQLRAELALKPGSASGSSTPLSPSTSSTASFATSTPNLSQLSSIPSEDTSLSHSSTSTSSSATSSSFVRSQLSLPSLTSDSKAGVRFPDHLSYVKWSPAPGLTWCKVTQVTEIKCPDPPLFTTPTFSLPSSPVTGFPSASSIKQQTTLPFGTLYAPDKCMLGLAQQILYLITANEMCGTKWGMFVYGSEFCRMIHLQRSNISETPHIAIEVAPNFNSNPGSAQSQSAATTPTQSTFARTIPAVSFIYNPQIRELFPNDLLKGSGIDSEAYNAFRDFYKAALDLCLSFTIEECSQRIGADQSPTIGQSGVRLQSRRILEADNIRLLTQTARWSQLRSTISFSSVSRRSSSPKKSTSPKKGENKEKPNKRQKGKSTDIGPQMPYRKRDDDDDDTGGGGGPKGGQRRTLRGFPGFGATTLPKSSEASQPEQGRGAQGGTSLSMSKLLFAKISAWSLAIQGPSVDSKDHSCYRCDGACQSDEGIHLSDYSDTSSQDSGIGSGETCESGIPLSVLVDIIHRMGVKIVGVTKGEMDQLMRLSATSGIAYPLESILAGSGD
ncbi:hypothetical protein BCR39DRAFT_562533 [Naematelia encephala]|uniref:Uncharacterized protein n=1 Tax=Naematelia encephala TaxID=71784 RepID=A0A1Y2AH36_9TREE|nr:hypothetical protein BCR39DRAFT_562533 [Naematelia encephala]